VVKDDIYFRGVHLVFILQANIYSGKGESPKRMLGNRFESSGKLRISPGRSRGSKHLRDGSQKVFRVLLNSWSRTKSESVGSEHCSPFKEMSFKLSEPKVPSRFVASYSSETRLILSSSIHNVSKYRSRDSCFGNII